ncbi:iron complex outermembrane recepter protein/hemoglobin/transferrin/lactoferrin receptor protein [bacterium JGI 053]|nr:iron complex outermembrane recepter protein/hemoglobin/transferrin/lactoferrin receptor protein [bacterium JGI 053]
MSGAFQAETRRNRENVDSVSLASSASLRQTLPWKPVAAYCSAGTHSIPRPNPMLIIPLLAAVLAAAPVDGAHASHPPIALSAAVDDTLRGTVADAAGRPIAGARVTILEYQRGTRTRRDGSFLVGGLPPGPCTVRVTAPGYAPLTRRVERVGDVGALALAERAFELEPVTVTAARSPQVAAGPLPSSTLGPERLRREHSVSLARTLATLPGVRALTTGEQVGKPVIRGLFGARVAVLADGLRLEDYSWSDEDAPSVDARLAERVEVVRGPASLLYGSDAVGGVVNVIPEPLPDAQGAAFARGGVETYFASGNLEGGLVARAEGAAASLGWRATVIGRLGQDLHTPGGEIPNTGFGAVNGELAVGASRPWGTLALRYQRYGGEFKLLEADGPVVGPAADRLGGVAALQAEEEEGGPERKLSDDRVQLSGNFPLPGVRIEARAQLQRHVLQEVADELPLTVDAAGAESVQFDLLLNTFTADVLAHLAPAGFGQATLGVSGLAQRNDSRGPELLVPDASIRSGGAFAVWQNDFGPLRLMAGARVDHRALTARDVPSLDLVADDDRDWTAVSWNAGGVLGVGGGLALTASVGRSWRAPTLFELYANGPRIGEARYDVGDPALEQERGLEIDGGVRWTGAAARAEVSVFRNAIDDFIVTAPTDVFIGGLRVFRTRQADALLRGVEAQAEARVLAPLTLRGVFDYVRGTERGTGDDLALIPPARGRVEAEYRAGGMPLLGHGYLTAAMDLVAKQTHAAEDELAPAGYALLELGAGTERRAAGRTLRIDLQVRNVLDTAYRDFLDRYKEFALSPGRSIVLRVATGI